MGTLKVWVQAARLRTLPLSLSGIIVGTALANLSGVHNTTIFVLALLTTVAFQVTSNFANDYGDGVKGTDDAGRIGPKRALQSGLLSKAVLKRGVIVTALCSFLLSGVLIYYVFELENILYIVIFLLLGILSIWAAIRYTVGRSAYGYRGLGDLFVFLFFGLLSVLGSYFLYVQSLSLTAILPALAIGLLSVGVLNLNNLRDVENDAAHGKNTLVVKMGFTNGKKYHFALLSGSFLSFFAYSLIENFPFYTSFFLLAYLPVFLHLRRILAVSKPENIDPELKKLALSTFLLALLFYVSINYFF